MLVCYFKKALKHFDVINSKFIIFLGLFGVYVESSDSTQVGNALIKSTDVLKSFADGELASRVEGCFLCH